MSPSSKKADNKDNKELIFCNRNTPRLYKDVNNSFHYIAIVNELANNEDQEDSYCNHNDNYYDKIINIP